MVHLVFKIRGGGGGGRNKINQTNNIPVRTQAEVSESQTGTSIYLNYYVHHTSHGNCHAMGHIRREGGGRGGGRRKRREGWSASLDLLNVNMNKYEQCQCIREQTLSGWWWCWQEAPLYFSSHHWFSLRTWASSSSVKSFLMLKVFLISSGVLPLIMLATVLQVTSSRPLMSR